MNTIHDLRNTLEQHAEGLDDRQQHARVVAVRGRVRAVRRRRTGVVAAAAAVAVVAGIVTAGSLRDPGSIQPAGPEVLGVEVPEEITVHGFPYEYAEARDLSGAGDQLRLPASDENRAVSLVATGLGSGSATLVLDGTPVSRAFDGEPVEAPVPAYASSEDTRVSVRLDGAAPDARVGVAVYDATGDLPEGVTDGVRVFREQVAGSHLLAADLTDSPEGLELPFAGTGSPLEHADFCSTSTPGVWMTVLLDDEEMYQAQCREEDGAVDVGSARSALGVLDGSHTLRIRLTRGHDGPAVAPDDVVLGLAVYEAPFTTAPRIAGFTPPEYVEWEGRTWRQVAADSVSRPVEVLPGQWSADTADALVGFVARGGTVVFASWRGDRTRGQSSGIRSPRAAAWTVAGVLLQGEDYRLELDGASDFTGGLVYYEPVDPADAW